MIYILRFETVVAKGDWLEQSTVSIQVEVTEKFCVSNCTVGSYRCCRMLRYDVIRR